MQTLTPLPDGAAIKITTAHYLTPRRRDINLRGIEPDLHIDENRDAQFGESIATHSCAPPSPSSSKKSPKRILKCQGP